jgi:hypothetical protein
MLEQAGNWISGAAKPVTDAIGTHVTGPASNFLARHVTGIDPEEMKKHLGFGLAGAGIGGIAGLGSEMLAPEKKRRPLSGLLTGSLLGAGLGAGGSLIHSNVEELQKPGPYVPPETLTGPNGTVRPPDILGGQHWNMHPAHSYIAGVSGVTGAGALDAAGSLASRTGGMRRPHMTGTELSGPNLEALKADLPDLHHRALQGMTAAERQNFARTGNPTPGSLVARPNVPDRPLVGNIINQAERARNPGVGGFFNSRFGGGGLPAWLGGRLPRGAVYPLAAGIPAALTELYMNSGAGRLTPAQINQALAGQRPGQR